MPLVWEVNSTPQLCHLKWSNEEAGNEENRLARFRQFARHASLAICNTQGLAGLRARTWVSAGGVLFLWVRILICFALTQPGQKMSLPIPMASMWFWCGNAAIAWHDLAQHH